MAKRRSTPNAMERLRVRIRDRLEELGVTARELAQACNKSDGWISGVLTGHQGVQLEMLDPIARRLSVPVGELVREEGSQLTELRPHELALLGHYRAMPSQVQERLLRVLEYFSASTPDPDAARVVDLWRDLPKTERRIALLYLQQRAQTGTPRPRLQADPNPQGQDDDTSETA